MINDTIPVRNRNKEWIKQQAMNIARNSSIKDVDYKLDETYWKYYNNQPDDKKHDYLRKVGENIELPVYYYHVPLQRTLIDQLVSQQSNRPSNFSISLCDKDSLKEKYNNQLKMYLDQMMDNAEVKIDMMNKITQEVQKKLQEMQQMIQQAQDPEVQKQMQPEQLQQIQQLQQQYPLIAEQAELQLKKIQKQSILTNGEIEQIKRHQKLSWKDTREIIAQKTLLHLRKELKIDKKSTRAFLSRLVTGKERYFVYYDGKNMLPEFEVLNPINVIYPLVEGVDNISKGKWAVRREKQSIHQILLQWGKEIQDNYGWDAIKDLNIFGNFNTSNGTFVSTPNNGAIFLDEVNSMFANNEGITVDRIYFKATRSQYIKYSPNINGTKDDLFRHFINSEKELLKKEDYKYKSYIDENGLKKEYYILKSNPTIVYDAKDVEFYSDKKGEEKKERFTTDRYEAIIINDKYVVGLKRSEYITRHIDRHSDVNLPIFGATYSAITEQPYSLIGATIDIQDLYDVVHMEQQLMISLSGTKGNIVDISQKPVDMTIEEWEYKVKTGTLYIQTKDPNGNNINASFNQWSSYDNTLSPSIQYLGMILKQLETTMGNIVGVGPQRQGKVVPSDQVATFEMAVQQNELVTQILYYDHDLEEAEALEELLHLVLRYSYINGDIIDVQDNELGSEMLYIPPQLLNGLQFKLHVANNSKDERTLKDIRNILLTSWKAGQTPISQLTDSMVEDSVTELRTKIRYWEDRASEIAAQNRQASKEDAIAIEEAKAKYRAEFENDWKQATLKLTEQGNQILSRNNELNAQLTARDLEIKAKSEEDKSKLKLLELLNEDKSETGVLMENKEARINAQNLEKLQIQLNAMMEGLNMNITMDKQKKDHDMNMKKVEIDKEKKLVKENVRD